jgi:hypothetical protein
VACAKETIREGGSETRVGFCSSEPSIREKQEKLMSKHNSVTKQKRRPKSDKRIDYTARTMAVLKQLSQAAENK